MKKPAGVWITYSHVLISFLLFHLCCIPPGDFYSKYMRSRRCHRALTCLAVTSLSPRGCSSGKSRRGYLTSRSRGFFGSSLLDTYMGQPQLCARAQSNTISTGHSANLLPRHNSALAGTRSVMDPPANVATLAPYDWRTFAPRAQLHYIRTEAATNERIARIASRPGPFIIGLDFEWRPTFEARRPENPIALVQLASDDEILLVHVSAMKGTPLHAAPVNFGRVLQSH